MDGSAPTVLGVVISVVGVIGSVVVARISTPKPKPDDQAAVGSSTPSSTAGTGSGLQVSPEIWRDLLARITGLETEVRSLKDAVELQTGKVTWLERQLRAAMRIIRAQSRTLRRNGLPDEQIPDTLIPYSID
jgi:hypothetical protein